MKNLLIYPIYNKGLEERAEISARQAPLLCHKLKEQKKYTKNSEIKMFKESERKKKRKRKRNLHKSN